MYKVTNKTSRHLKYAGVVFSPNETKELKDAYEHENFHIEKIEEPKSKKKVIKEEK